jgi:hypothetical protein
VPEQATTLVAIVAIAASRKICPEVGKAAPKPRRSQVAPRRDFRPIALESLRLLHGVRVPACSLKPLVAGGGEMVILRSR